MSHYKRQVQVYDNSRASSSSSDDSIDWEGFFNLLTSPWGFGLVVIIGALATASAYWR